MVLLYLVHLLILDSLRIMTIVISLNIILILRTEVQQILLDLEIMLVISLNLEIIPVLIICNLGLILTYVLTILTIPPTTYLIMLDLSIKINVPEYEDHIFILKTTIKIVSPGVF